MVFLRGAQEKDIPAIKRIADANKRFLGFTKNPALKESAARSELHVALIGREVAGFIRWHKRRDGWITIYEICVSESRRNQGIGKKLMEVVGQGPARVKCHSDNPALLFYDRLGFKKVDFETTRAGRRLDCLEKTYYKVLDQELFSLGLRGATPIRYTIGEWIRPLEPLSPQLYGRGGLWVARRKGTALQLKRYMLNAHGKDVRIFSCRIGVILCETSGRFKTDKVMVLEEI